MKTNLRAFIISGVCMATMACSGDGSYSGQSAITLNDMGVDYLIAGDNDMAIESFHLALAAPGISNETKAQVYRNIGQTYSDMDHADSCIYYYTQAAHCYDEGSYKYLINKADIDIFSGHTDKAIQKLTKAYALEPNQMDVNNTLGLIYLGDYGEDYQDYELALTHNLKTYSLDPNRISEDVLARNYYDLKNYDKAIEHYENLMLQYPEYLDYKYYMGTLMYELDKKEEGDVYFDEVLAADSTYNDIIMLYRIDLSDLNLDDLGIDEDALEDNDMGDQKIEGE